MSYSKYDEKKLCEQVQVLAPSRAPLEVKFRYTRMVTAINALECVATAPRAKKKKKKNSVKAFSVDADRTKGGSDRESRTKVARQVSKRREASDQSVNYFSPLSERETDGQQTTDVHASFRWHQRRWATLRTCRTKTCPSPKTVAN